MIHSLSSIYDPLKSSNFQSCNPLCTRLHHILDIQNVSRQSTLILPDLFPLPTTLYIFLINAVIEVNVLFCLVIKAITECL